jgi:hypothetical protein
VGIIMQFWLPVSPFSDPNSYFASGVRYLNAVAFDLAMGLLPRCTSAPSN